MGSELTGGKYSNLTLAMDELKEDHSSQSEDFEVEVDDSEFAIDELEEAEKLMIDGEIIELKGLRTNDEEHLAGSQGVSTTEGNLSFSNIAPRAEVLERASAPKQLKANASFISSPAKQINEKMPLTLSSGEGTNDGSSVSKLQGQVIEIMNSKDALAEKYQARIDELQLSNYHLNQQLSEMKVRMESILTQSDSSINGERHKFSILSDQLSALKIEKDSLAEKCRSLEKRESDQELSMKLLKNSVENYEEKLAQADERNNNLLKKLKQFQQQVPVTKDYESKIFEQNAVIDDLNQKLQEQSEQFSKESYELKSKRQSLEIENDNLKTKLSISESNFNQMQAELDTTYSLSTQYQNQLEAVRTNADIIRHENNQLKSSIAKLESNLKQVSEERKQADNLANASKLRLEAMENQIKELNEKTKVLSQQGESMQIEKEEFASSYNALLEDYNLMKASSEEQMQLFYDENQGLASQLDSVLQENYTCKSELDTLKEELAKKNVQLEKSNNELHGAQRELTLITEQLKVLQEKHLKECEHYKSLLSENNRNREGIESDFVILRAEHSKLSESYANVIKELQNARSEISDHLEKENQTSYHLDELNAQIVELSEIQNQKNLLEQDLKKAADRESELNLKLNDAVSRLDQCELEFRKDLANTRSECIGLLARICTDVSLGDFEHLSIIEIIESVKSEIENLLFYRDDLCLQNAEIQEKLSMLSKDKDESVSLLDEKDRNLKFIQSELEQLQMSMDAVNEELSNRETLILEHKSGFEKLTSDFEIQKSELESNINFVNELKEANSLLLDLQKELNEKIEVEIKRSSELSLENKDLSKKVILENESSSKLDLELSSANKLINELNSSISILESEIKLKISLLTEKDLLLKDYSENLKLMEELVEKHNSVEEHNMSLANALSLRDEEIFNQAQKILIENEKYTLSLSELQESHNLLSLSYKELEDLSKQLKIENEELKGYVLSKSELRLDHAYLENDLNLIKSKYEIAQNEVLTLQEHCRLLESSQNETSTEDSLKEIELLNSKLVSVQNENSLLKEQCEKLINSMNDLNNSHSIEIAGFKEIISSLKEEKNSLQNILSQTHDYKKGIAAVNNDKAENANSGIDNSHLIDKKENERILKEYSDQKSTFEEKLSEIKKQHDEIATRLSLELKDRCSEITAQAQKLSSHQNLIDKQARVLEAYKSKLKDVLNVTGSFEKNLHSLKPDHLLVKETPSQSLSDYANDYSEGLAVPNFETVLSYKREFVFDTKSNSWVSKSLPVTKSTEDQKSLSVVQKNVILNVIQLRSKFFSFSRQLF
jgi:chromosome segregation ATPase